MIVSGNVGIGTTGPAVPLEIYSSANGALFEQIATPGTQSSQESAINLVTQDNGSGLGAAGNLGWSILARGNAFGTTAQQNEFAITYWNGSAFTPGFWINTSGNVGIGTTSPNALLDVNSTSIIIEQSHTPADNATCTAGTHWWDANFIYVCTASGTVKRAALSAF